MCIEDFKWAAKLKMPEMLCEIMCGQIVAKSIVIQNSVNSFCPTAAAGDHPKSLEPIRERT